MKLERKNSGIIFLIFGVVFVLNSLNPVMELLYIKAKGEIAEAKIDVKPKEIDNIILSIY